MTYKDFKHICQRIENIQAQWGNPIEDDAEIVIEDSNGDFCTLGFVNYDEEQGCIVVGEGQY